MDAPGEGTTSRILTLGAALLLIGLLSVAVGAVAMGMLGFALPHLCAAW
jgi:hypothetical protein